jgi:hypothetical protein
MVDCPFAWWDCDVSVVDSSFLFRNSSAWAPRDLRSYFAVSELGLEPATVRATSSECNKRLPKKELSGRNKPLKVDQKVDIYTLL